MKILNKKFREAYNDFMASTQVKEILGAMEKSGSDNGSMLIDITSESEDRHGDKVLQAGLDFSKWSGGVIGDHDYRLEKFVGKGVAKKLDKGVTEMKVNFAPTPYAQFVRELHDAKMPLMASIGFIPTAFDEEDRSIIKEAEVIEVSIVVVGSNRDANVKMTEEMKVKCKEFGIEIKDADEVKNKDLTKEEKTDQRLDAIEKKLDAGLTEIKETLKNILVKKEIDEELEEKDPEEIKKEEEEVKTEEEAKKYFSETVKALQKVNNDFSKGLHFLKKVRNEDEKED